METIEKKTRNRSSSSSRLGNTINTSSGPNPYFGSSPNPNPSPGPKHRPSPSHNPSTKPFPNPSSCPNLKPSSSPIPRLGNNTNNRIHERDSFADMSI